MNFYSFMFVGFLLLNKNVFFKLSSFSITAFNSQGTIQSAAVSRWAGTKFSNSPYKYVEYCTFSGAVR